MLKNWGDKNNVGSILCDKLSFSTNLCRKKGVDSKFHKEVIKRSIGRVHRFRSDFQKSGYWHLLHDSGSVYSSGILSEFLV
jgi:hypothetical protein